MINEIVENDTHAFLELTVEDFYRLFHKFGNRIEVKSAFNGKILCKNYIALSSDRRVKSPIGARQITTIEAGFYTDSNLSGIYPKIILWVEGHAEYEEQSKKSEKSNE